MARKINREIVVVVGWGRAILLQLAHPLIAAAISDGSSFHGGAGSYARRAHRTIGAMLDLTFGTDADAQRIVDTINGIHDRIHGRLGAATGIFPAGTPYSARDGRLLVWVHTTLVDSLVLTYEQLVGPLTREEKDQYAAESAWLARELGAPADLVPSDVAGVAAFMGDMHARGEICVGEDARRMADALLAPGIAVAAPVFWTSALITVGIAARRRPAWVRVRVERASCAKVSAGQDDGPRDPAAAAANRSRVAGRAPAVTIDVIRRRYRRSPSILALTAARPSATMRISSRTLSVRMAALRESSSRISYISAKLTCNLVTHLAHLGSKRAVISSPIWRISVRSVPVISSPIWRISVRSVPVISAPVWRISVRRSVVARSRSWRSDSMAFDVSISMMLATRDRS